MPSGARSRRNRNQVKRLDYAGFREKKQAARQSERRGESISAAQNRNKQKNRRFDLSGCKSDVGKNSGVNIFD
jgi:hypothetical protein